MIRHLVQKIQRTRMLLRISFAMARAAATAPLRRLNATRPDTWEFSGFSQNGEDGIIDFLVQQVADPNRYFGEIGASDGVENNTAWLALGRRYSGIMVEGSERLVALAGLIFPSLNHGVDFRCLFVDKEYVAVLR